VFNFLLNTAILETLTISNGRLFQISIILFAKLYTGRHLDIFWIQTCPLLCCVGVLREKQEDRARSKRYRSTRCS